MNRPTPPPSTVSDLNLDGIPDELKERAQWVVWRYEHRDDKWTKVPYQAATGRRADSTNAATWATFDAALAAAKADGYDGIGFVFTKDDPYCGIDLDDCLDEEGKPVPEAQRIVDKLNSYTEVSPSRKGVKVWIKGGLPGKKTGRRTKPKTFAQIEAYRLGRYFTVTGWRLESSPAGVENRQAHLFAIYAEYFACKGQEGRKARAAEKARRTSGSAWGFRGTDDELVEKARTSRNGPKFELLWTGDWSEYPSQSEADLALCSLLAFYAGNDPDRIDRLFRGSGLMRQKWDERRHGDGRTYGEGTIEQALSDRTEFYAHRPESAKRSFKRTDLGNAERLVHRFGRDLRYCHTQGRFYVWNGKRWAVDESGRVMRFASRTARAIYREVSLASDKDERQKLLSWAKESEARARLEAMVALGRSRDGIPVLCDKLDADPWLLNCRNGTIDLRTGELLPHRREDLITHLAPVHFDPAATCPLFDEFLQTTFSGDAGLIEYVERLLGMCLTGDVTEQLLPIFHGDGNNGKSVLLDTVSGLMGDYAAEAPPDLLASKQGERHATELADLQGRRLVVASETEEGSQLRLQLVKRLTGNARIKGRFMRQDFFEFERTHKIILVTNNKPVIRENTEAAWRRLRLVPFDHVVPKEQRDKKLLSKLRKEWPGILARLVRGCLRWQHEDLDEPEAVLVATDGYRKESDDIAEFVAECCVLQPTAWVSSKSLREEYEGWCKERGSRPRAGRAFSTRLRSLNCRPDRMHGERGWLGMGLRK